MFKSSLIFKNQNVLTGADNGLIAWLSYETSTSLTNSDDEEHQSEEKKGDFDGSKEDMIGCNIHSSMTDTCPKFIGLVPSSVAPRCVNN